MKSFRHVCNTWLLALHLFPVVFLAWSFLRSGTIEFDLLLVLFFFAAFFSIPALLLCLLLFHGIKKLRLDAFTKIGLWLFAVLLAVVLCLGFVAYQFDTPFTDRDFLPFVSSALIAAALSILLRLKQFIYLATSQNNDYENNMV